MLNKLLGITEDVSAHGAQIDTMMEIVHWFMLLLGLGWGIFFLVAVWKFRASRNPRANYHGVTSTLSSHLEIAVIVAEACILFGFAYPSWHRRVLEVPDRSEAVVVRAVGQQFLWSFHYPGADGVFGRRDPMLVSSANPVGLDATDAAAKDDIVVQNQMHVPKDKPVIVEVSSKDVIHNFAVPNLRIAHDAIPGMQVPMTFTALKPGDYEIVCAQLCGLGHALMRAVITVDEAPAFDEWLKTQAPAVGVATAMR
jgi:cytochrome c oxidase subunit 2